MCDKVSFSRIEKKVTVGFDGYIDNILRVKKTANEYFHTMTEFGEFIQDRANFSGSLELHRSVEKIGGNMPIFALALSTLDVPITCIGAMGYPEVLPIFTPLLERCEIKSISNPGYCDALEFDDGKLMLALNEEIENLDFEMLLKRAGKGYLLNAFEQSDMIVLLNWSELKGSLSIWRGLKHEIFPKLSKKERELFIDLSDCTGRSNEEIKEVIYLIKEFSKVFSVSVSLNGNEANKIAETCGIFDLRTEDIAMKLYEYLRCNRLIIHLVDCCYCAYQNKIHMGKTRYIEHPVISTGGGDNFNAGFVYGILNGLDCNSCIHLANSVSCFYVAIGHSPMPVELYKWNEEG